MGWFVALCIVAISCALPLCAAQVSGTKSAVKINKKKTDTSKNTHNTQKQKAPPPPVPLTKNLPAVSVASVTLSNDETHPPAATLQETKSEARVSPTQLPLPRFVSIKANEANLHVGPGNTYPVEWKYVRKSLPVEVIAEFEHWRQVRDVQGTVGWLHKSLLAGKRFALVWDKVVNLYTGPDESSPVLATVEPGVSGKLQECFQHLCKIDIQGIKGWVKREFLWGVYPDEAKF